MIIGNGNVALDVARVLTGDPDDLARTDISDHALEAFRRSAVREVVIAARRGPAHSAFTLPELIGLTSRIRRRARRRRPPAGGRDLATASDTLTRNKLEILSKLGDGSAPWHRARESGWPISSRPQRVLGEQRATGVEFSVTGTDEMRRLDAGLVLTSIGYRGKPIRDLPFDESAAVVPNDGGRVVDPGSGQPVPGAYVAGWIKRGPTGFIGTNKSCSFQTVAGPGRRFQRRQAEPTRSQARALDKLVHARQPDVVDSAGWRAIDAAEIARGSRDGRPRNKFTDVADMLAAAATAQPAPPMRRRLLARLRD